MSRARHQAGVLGKPIAHSLAPVNHNAGYAAAGLAGWSYTARECAEAELADLVAGLDERWAGLSLTMPLKEVALGVAAEVTPLAAALGAANTLVRRPEGWLADNTDAPGMVDALRWAGVTTAPRIAVLGAGGTARAALGAAVDLGAEQMSVYARRPEAIDELVPVAAQLGVALEAPGWSRVAEAIGADLLISTLPKGAGDAVATTLRPAAPLTVFDVLYDPWPTPLAAAAQDAGCTVVGGLELLLAQAVRQFELFTGVAAPVAAMREALAAAAAR